MEKESINHVLFDFYAIVDTDVGIARVMNRFYNNPSLVNTAVLGQDIETYKILMLNRKYHNPLIMFINEQYRSDADAIYMEMTHREDVYSKILGLSITTSIFEMMTKSLGMPAIEPTVLCWNEAQAEYVKSLVNGVDTVVHSEEPLDASKYDTLIFKFPYPNEMFTDEGDDIHGKNIYICRYKFNMADQDTSKLKVTDEIKRYSMSANDFYIIEVYADATLETSKEEIE